MAESNEHIYPFTAGDLREFEFDNGTRLFAELWETCSVAELRSHATKLDGLEVSLQPNSNFDSGSLLSFHYLGFEFFVTASQSEYMFYVTKTVAPDSILMTVATHFNQLLRRTTRGKARFVAYDAESTKIDPGANP